jgi:hypothetical protein
MLHNEELHNLYPSQIIIRVIKPRRVRRVLHVTWLGGIRNLYIFLDGKPERMIPLGRLGRENILKWIFEELGSDDEDWIHQAQHRASGGVL